MPPYEIRYFDWSGRQRWETIYGSLREAEARRAELRPRRWRGQPAGPSVSFAAYARAWLEMQDVRPRTLEGYRWALAADLLERFLCEVVDEVLLDAYPSERHGWAIGVWSGVAALCGALGPVVGGGVVQAIGWHWIFWVNLPIGLAILPVALLRFRESYGGHPRLDVVGLALATGGLFAITWAIVRTDTHAWGSTTVVAPLAAGVAIIGAFLLWERRTPQPMLSLALFRRASFSAGNGIGFCLFASLFGALFLMSQFFQIAQGRTPLQTGAGLLVWSAWGFFVAPAAARAAGRYGNRPFMLAGLTLQALGLGCLALIANQHTPYLELVPMLGLSGIGSSMVFSTVAGEVMTSVEPDQIGIASGTNNALRELGGVFGIAVLATVFNRPGVYSSPETFVSGFRSGLWVAVAFATVGIVLTGFLKPRASHVAAEMSLDASAA